MWRNTGLPERDIELSERCYVFLRNRSFAGVNKISEPNLAFEVPHSILAAAATSGTPVPCTTLAATTS